MPGRAHPPRSRPASSRRRPSRRRGGRSQGGDGSGSFLDSLKARLAAAQAAAQHSDTPYGADAVCGLDWDGGAAGWEATAAAQSPSHDRAEQNRFSALRDLRRPATAPAAVDHDAHDRVEDQRFETLAQTQRRDVMAEWEEEVQATDAQTLLDLTSSYTNIPVVIGIGGDGLPELQHIQAPYAHNGTKNSTWTEAKARLDANPIYRQMVSEGLLHSGAWDSDATPEQMRIFLQRSVDAGLVSTSVGALRDWLVAHNFTVDCSSMVGHALSALGHEDEVRGWSQNYLSGEGVSEPDAAQIRTGDIMVRPIAETGIGHVRIVVDVERDGDTIRFRTTESSAIRDLSTETSGSTYGSVGLAWWRFSISEGWAGLQRSPSGEEGSFESYNSTDVLRRLDAVAATPEKPAFW